MKENPHLPDPSRLSVLTATILLSFALTRILNVPQGNISIPVFGLMLTIPIGLNLAITLLSAALTAAGMDWLLRTHSSLEEGETREHWLLPALTVLVLGITLNTLPDGLTWWLGFALGAILLVLVFISEYVAVDPSDIRYPMATATLTSLAFAIFLVLAGALKASNGRLFLVAPALFGGSFLAALRTLHLRLNERWEYRLGHRHRPGRDAVRRSLALLAVDSRTLWPRIACPGLCTYYSRCCRGKWDFFPKSCIGTRDHARTSLGIDDLVPLSFMSNPPAPFVFPLSS